MEDGEMAVGVFVDPDLGLDVMVAVTVGRADPESGTEEMASVFAALRVRPAHRDARRSTPRPEQWLLVEWCR